MATQKVQDGHTYLQRPHVSPRCGLHPTETVCFLGLQLTELNWTKILYLCSYNTTKISGISNVLNVVNNIPCSLVSIIFVHPKPTV